MIQNGQMIVKMKSQHLKQVCLYVLPYISYKLEICADPKSVSLKYLKEAITASKFSSNVFLRAPNDHDST